MAVPFGINSTSVILLSKGFPTRLPYYNHGYPKDLPTHNGACQFQAWERLPVDRPRHTINWHTLKFIQYMIDPTYLVGPGVVKSSFPFSSSSLPLPKTNLT